MTKTSLNINIEIFDLMVKTADSMDISVSTLIKRAVARFSKQYTPLVEPSDNSVSYQNRGKGAWHIFPISFSQSEYEQCLDVRKIWKMSVSFFVSAAFIHFLHFPDLEEEPKSDLKNSYMLDTYTFEKKLINKTIVLTAIWGKKPKNWQKE